MSLSKFELKRIEKIFTEYCEKRVPIELRSQIRIEYRVRGDEVKLYGSSPVWDGPAKGISGKVARFKKAPKPRPGFSTGVTPRYRETAG